MCLALGFAHPDYLLQELTSNQLSEWEAYDKLDPINNNWRQDLNTAKLSSLIINIVNALYHDPKKGEPDVSTPINFMPIWDDETEEQRKAIQERQTPEQMRDYMLEFARVQNARVNREQRMKRTTPPVIKKKN